MQRSIFCLTFVFLVLLAFSLPAYFADHTVFGAHKQKQPTKR